MMVDPKRPVLIAKALTHYRKRLTSISKDEDIESITSDFTKSVLYERISLVDNILNDLDTQDYNKIQNRRDIYYGIICRALNCYVVDLENFVRQVNSKLGIGAPSLDEIPIEIEKIREIIPIFCSSSQNH